MVESKRYKDTKYLVFRNGIILNEKTGRAIKPQNNGNGYLKVTLTIQGKQIQRYVHRLVAKAFIPNPENKAQVNHIDGDKNNNKADNLEWCNNKENQLHAHKTGLKPNGSGLWNGKFSSEDIKTIFKLDRSGLKRYMIAEKMNCSKSTISDILNKKRYKYTSPSQEKNSL